MIFLDIFCGGHWGAQNNSNVLSDILATKRQGAGVLNGVIDEDGNIRGAAANIHEGNANTALFCGQNSLGRCQRFQNHISHIEAATVTGADDILHSRHSTRHDMDFHLKAHARHAQRVGDAALIVHHILLWQGV